MTTNKQSMLEKFKLSIDQKAPLIGVSIGNGRSARQAEVGGADMVACLNAGRFRMAGVSSMASLLPFENSNQAVRAFSKKEVIPRIKHIPVIFGACAQDPLIDHAAFVKTIKRDGFHGVNNFPTVSLIDGAYRAFLESEDQGFDQEVKLMRTAQAEGLLTVAFAVTLDEAIKMAKDKVDVLCLHFGWTASKLPVETEKKEAHLSHLIHKAREVFEEVLALSPLTIPLIYGGAFVKDKDVIKRFYEETPVVGYFGGSVFDTLPKEASLEKATEQFKNMNRVSLLEMENETLKKRLKAREGVGAILGESKPMKDLMHWVDKVSQYNANTLIEGESGTGKDLVVKAIHYNSPRAMYPLKKMNCASMPEAMVETELFGYEKGAFHGSESRHIGHLEKANQGTLFLDNVNDLSLSVQGKLLQAIQDKEFQRLGGSETITLDIRVIATANTELKVLVKKGLFREDLYYLLTVLNRTLPPLKEHKEDIPVFVHAFLAKISERHGVKVEVTKPVVEALMSYDWPGNVRELKNVLERGVIMCDDGLVDLSCLPAHLASHKEEETLSSHIKNTSMVIEKELILSELMKHNWNQTRVAKALGVSRRTLYNKLQKYHLSKKSDVKK